MGCTCECRRVACVSRPPVVVIAVIAVIVVIVVIVNECASTSLRNLKQ